MPQQTVTQQLLNEVLKKNGWSQFRLAELLGTSRQSVARWVRGEVQISDSYLLQLAKHHQIDCREILVKLAVEGTDEKQAKQIWRKLLKDAKEQER